jgi:hypothetical protein
MNVEVINEYKRWAERHMVDKKPITCLSCNLPLLPMVEPLAILLKCVLCGYSKDLGYGEYIRFAKLNIMAEKMLDQLT